MGSSPAWTVYNEVVADGDSWDGGFSESMRDGGGVVNRNKELRYRY